MNVKSANFPQEKTKDNKEKIKLNRQLPHLVRMPQFFVLGFEKAQLFFC